MINLSKTMVAFYFSSKSIFVSNIGSTEGTNLGGIMTSLMVMFMVGPKITLL